MSRHKICWGVLSVALLGSLSFASGCYRPSIPTGGFTCAPGKVCPDGFQCASNNVCFKGDGGPTCSSPPPTPTCSTEPDGGVCNPVCGTGCECGWCSVADGKTACLTVTQGTKNVGDVCNPQSEADCAPGLFCRPECAQAAIGRCYKYCAANSDCPNGGSCGVSQTSGGLLFHLCNLPSQTCDPVGGTSGCQTTNPQVFACYPDGNGQTACYCKGVTPVGGPCKFISNCDPGKSCVPLAGTNSCQPTCATTQDCAGAPGTTCTFQSGSTTYGDCQ
jgi:hypothetical protein